MSLTEQCHALIDRIEDHWESPFNVGPTPDYKATHHRYTDQFATWGPGYVSQLMTDVINAFPQLKGVQRGREAS